MKSGGALSIWFFIGVCLGVNGALIFATGIYEIFHPPAEQVVLSNIHANVWWGGVLLIFGLIYAIRFSPVRERKRLSGNS
jgi:hypothetical protein